MIRTSEEHLAHYGILRKSGRYPWGSGNTQKIRNQSFLDIIAIQRKEGLTEAQIAKSHNMSRNDLTALRSMVLAEQRQAKILTAERLRSRGWSHEAIAQRMGLPGESSVRALLLPGAKDKANALQITVNMIKKQVDEKDMIDVGKGVEHHIGITKDRLSTAVAVLKEQGYTVHTVFIPQVTNRDQFTNMKVLAKPDITTGYVNKNRARIKQFTDYSEDNGRSFFGIQPPISIDSKRLDVKYVEDDGHKLDGVIYVRPGVKDIAIGANRYGQVRILVDGTHYLKGMAIYNENLPSGTDLVFHTNKSKKTGWKTDNNKVSKNPDNPFGAVVRQIHDPNTRKVTSAMNLVGSPSKEGSGEEGQWDTWSKALSSQVLSKQSPKLAEQQLRLKYIDRRREFDEINALTNPVVRRELLLKFADATDYSASHLEAATLPRQATKVLLPLSTIKPTEIYAPTFNDGTRVVLIRHPHAGTFEIPELTVNNKNKEGRRLIGTGANNPRHDAIGIHHKVAQHLSGADFDGDTVLVIPNNRGTIQKTLPLEGLKHFDTMDYRLPDDSPIRRMGKSEKQREMGKISNLITDMSLGGATREELARAVRHSMVVIDAEKHGLDFRQSEKDNAISSLKEEYQGGKSRGAHTLISKAGAKKRVDEIKLRSSKMGGPIDKTTGKKIWVKTGRTKAEVKKVTDPNTGKSIWVETGRPINRQTKVDRLLSITEDAHSLIESPGTQMERIYADHSNRLKAMANNARKEAVAIRSPKRSPSAAKVYAPEVTSLKSKLQISERNAPLERQAQVLAGHHVAQLKQATPGMDEGELKKIRQIALNKARNRTGALKHRIDLTQGEWNAIQAGAISTDVLERILKNTDSDSVKRLAMPKKTPKMTSNKVARAKLMLANGYTQAEVAAHLGVGLTTLKVGLNE